MPVLKYRAMVHGVPSPSLHSRDYGYRYNIDWHCDLLEALSDFGASTRVKLDEVCKLLGLPGKLGIDGFQVAEMYETGRIEDIRNYCETDV
ncbi:MAG: 3'-5' exonuclease, partial [Proteobacteria bacterium]|nr:3'-5' exonuclease [Pseudomonadota bacterium]